MIEHKKLQTEIKENFFQLSTDELKAVLEFIQDIINQRIIIPEEDEPTWLTPITINSIPLKENEND